MAAITSDSRHRQWLLGKNGSNRLFAAVTENELRQRQYNAVLFTRSTYRRIERDNPSLVWVGAGGGNCGRGA